MHVVHVIHDFLPRHRAGSEIYVYELVRRQSSRHHVTVVCAEYDPARAHGHVEWRVHDGLPVVEVVNNWRTASFEESYRPPLIGQRIEHLLDVLRPDVVHVHNLLNLSFDLPAIARAKGIPVVATLHDYTLVCASGGQRIHRAEAHVCHDIDVDRCARCFRESPFHAQTSFAAVTAGSVVPEGVLALARATARRVPGFARLAGSAVRAAGQTAVTAADVDRRLEAARRAWASFDLIVAPSASIAREYTALGLPPDRLVVSDYGFPQRARSDRPVRSGPLRIGFVGTLVWHKGVHVLVEALSHLDPSSYEGLLFGSTETFPAYTRELRARALGLPVRFMGGFDDAMIDSVYAAMDVLVVPSIWLENSPLVIHEAFMAGVPVVGARIGGIPDLVVDDVSGLLFEAGSPRALAGALQRLMDDPGLVVRLAAGAPDVKSIDADADKWDDRYQQVLSEYASDIHP